MTTLLHLPFPPSLNGLFNGGRNTKRRFKSDKYQTWLTHAGLMLNTQRRDIKEHKASIKVTYRFTPPDKRRRDLGNLEKALSDFLVLHKVIIDDSLIEELRLVWARKANQIGVVVLVEDVTV